MQQAAPKKQQQPPQNQQFPQISQISSARKYNILQKILISLRLFPAALIMGAIIVFHDFIKPRVMIDSVRRYLSCVVNLIGIRVVLLLLGVWKFQCENYQYFNKRARMMTFRSGWVGMATHNTVFDFLYYSYIFSPTYARMIEYHDEQGNVKLFYTPLSFKDAFFAALSYRGFDPIVIKGEDKLKKIKIRKMLMPTLISECFQQFNGPILIFLPTVGYKSVLAINKNLGQDIFDNQKKFLRSGLIFWTELQEISFQRDQRKIAEMTKKIYFNQLKLIFEICSIPQFHVISTVAIQLIKHKYEYNRQTYATFADDTFTQYGFKIIQTNFEKYLKQMEKAEEMTKEDVSGDSTIIQRNEKKQIIEQKDAKYKKQQNTKI